MLVGVFVCPTRRVGYYAQLECQRALPIYNMNDAIPSIAQDMSPSALEPTASKEREGDKMIKERDSTMPKDIRFWLIMIGLMVATFLAALDLTGIIFHFGIPIQCWH